MIISRLSNFKVFGSSKSKTSHYITVVSSGNSCFPIYTTTGVCHVGIGPVVIRSRPNQH